MKLLCETDFVAKNEEFRELARDLAMHVAAMSPRYISFEKADKEEIAEFERSIREEISAEPARNASRGDSEWHSDTGGKKPVEIVEKIVSGKVKKHFHEISLLSQPYVKNPDMTVQDLLTEKISKIGENIQIVDFARFEV